MPVTERRHQDDIALHAHRFLLRAGLAIGNVFGWIFVFDYFLLLSGDAARALGGTLVLYGLSHGITAFLTPIAAAHLGRGARSAVVWALVCAAGAFLTLGVVLGGVLSNPANLVWAIAGFAVFLGAYRALYVVPYALQRANVAGAPPEDRAFFEMLLALFPAFAGVTLLTQLYAPMTLLFGTATFIVLSSLPLFLMRNILERFSYSYTETFKELFAYRNRRLLWSALLEGMQGAALFLLWPLAVFLIVGSSYALLGVVFSITLLIILLFRMLWRRLAPRDMRRYSTPTYVVLAVSGWVARLVAGTPVGVAIADVYAYTTHSPRGTSVDPFTFEQAADAGTYIDEHTALKELGLAFGRIAFVFIIGSLVLFVPVVIVFAVAFVLAAVSAGVSVLLARRREVAVF